MNVVNRFAASIALLVTLTLPVCAGEMSTPPCPPPVPGEMSAPPCSATQQTSDDPTQGQTQTTTTATAVTETIITDTATDVVLGSILSLF